MPTPTPNPARDAMDHNDVKPDLYFVECFTGQKWIPLDCLPKEEAELHANFMRLGAVKPEDVRLVPLETVMKEKAKPE